MGLSAFRQGFVSFGRAFCPSSVGLNAVHSASLTAIALENSEKLIYGFLPNFYQPLLTY